MCSYCIEANPTKHPKNTSFFNLSYHVSDSVLLNFQDVRGEVICIDLKID